MVFRQDASPHRLASSGRLRQGPLLWPRRRRTQHASEVRANVASGPARCSAGQRGAVLFSRLIRIRLTHGQLQPINFLSLLHPSSSPPYHLFVSRIIKFSDQQASIFLQQKLKIADSGERAKIIDAICAKGFEMMAHR